MTSWQFLITVFWCTVQSVWVILLQRRLRLVNVPLLNASDINGLCVFPPNAGSWSCHLCLDLLKDKASIYQNQNAPPSWCPPDPPPPLPCTQSSLNRPTEVWFTFQDRWLTPLTLTKRVFRADGTLWKGTHPLPNWHPHLASAMTVAQLPSSHVRTPSILTFTSSPHSAASERHTTAETAKISLFLHSRLHKLLKPSVLCNVLTLEQN